MMTMAGFVGQQVDAGGGGGGGPTYTEVISEIDFEVADGYTDGDLIKLRAEWSQYNLHGNRNVFVDTHPEQPGQVVDLSHGGAEFVMTHSTAMAGADHSVRGWCWPDNLSSNGGYNGSGLMLRGSTDGSGDLSCYLVRRTRKGSDTVRYATANSTYIEIIRLDAEVETVVAQSAPLSEVTYPNDSPMYVDASIFGDVITVTCDNTTSGTLDGSPVAEFTHDITGDASQLDTGNIIGFSLARRYSGGSSGTGQSFIDRFSAGNLT